MSNPVSIGQVTITDQNDTPTFVFTRDPILVRITEASASGVFDNTTSTTVSLLLGTYNDTSNWRFNVTKSSGVVCSEAASSTTQTVTSMSTSAGTITFTASKTGYGPISSTVDIIKLIGANSVIDAKLGRQSSSVNADSGGIITDFLDTGNEIRVYCGSIPLDYDNTGTTTGHYKVTAEGFNITPGTITSIADSGDNIYTETIFESGVYYNGQLVNIAKVNNITGFDQSQDSGTIRFTIEGKDFYGNNFQLSKVQTFNKNKAAATTPVYEITSLPTTLARKKDGTLDTTAVNFYAWKTDGNNTKTTYDGRFILSWAISGGVYTHDLTSIADEPFCQFNNIDSRARVLKCELYEAGGTTTLLDVQTVPILDDGSDSISATLSNESHNIPADAAGGNAVFTGAVCTMTVYTGSIDDSANWSFSSSGFNVGYTQSNSNRTVTITSMAASYSSGYVDITATKGTASITKRFTLTKLAGPQGAGLVGISNRGVVFSKSASGIITPSSVILTLDLPNVTSPTYQWKKNGVNGVTTPTYTIPSTDFTNATSNIYSITVSGYISGILYAFNDSIIVPRIDEASGSPTIQLTNQDMTFSGPTGTGYTPIDFTSGGCVITASIGSLQLSYAATGANTFRCTNDSQGITVATGTGSGQSYTIPQPISMNADNATTNVYVTICDANNVSLPTITKVISYSLVRTGASGPRGSNSCIVYAYQRSATTLASNPGIVSVNVSAGTIITTPLANNWFPNIPSSVTGQDLYITAASAVSDTGTAIVQATQWSAPSIFAKDGTGGFNNATLFLHQRTTSNVAPAAISGSITYDFTTSTIVTPIAPWVKAIPVSGGEYIWQTYATASSSLNSDSISASEWSSPALYSKPGPAGLSYALKTDVLKIERTKTGFSPATITFYSTTTEGTNLPQPFSCYYKLYLNDILQTPSLSGATRSSLIVTPKANTAKIRVETYDTPQFTLPFIDQQEITIGGITTQAILDAFMDGGLSYTQNTDPYASFPQLVFSRASSAYKQDGSIVTINKPRIEKARIGRGIFIEESTTNLLSNPSFEVNKTSWNTYGAQSTAYSRSTDFAYRGSASCKIESRALTGWQGCSTNIVPSVGEWYTFSFYARAGIGSPETEVRIESHNSIAQITTLLVQNFTLTNDWERHEYSVQVPIGSVILYACIYIKTTSVIGESFYFDCAQLEKKQYATSYIEDTRAEETLSFPLTGGEVSRNQGTISCWLYTTPLTKKYNVGGVTRTIWWMDGNVANDRLALYHDMNSSLWGLVACSGGAPWAITAVHTTTPDNEWAHFAVTWSKDEAPKLYINSEYIDQLPVNYIPSVLTNFYIGSSNVSRQINGLIDEFCISKTYKTDEDIALEYYALEPQYKNVNTEMLAQFNADVWNNSSSGEQKIWNGIDWTVTATVGVPNDYYVGDTLAQNVSEVIGNSDGRGINICNPNYSSFEQSGLPVPILSNAGYYLDNSIYKFNPNSLRFTSNGPGSYILFTPAATGYNIRIEPNKKWLLSAYVYSTTASATAQFVLNTPTSGARTLTFTTFPLANKWSRIAGTIDLTGDSNNTICYLSLATSASNGTIFYLDAIMLEEKIGNGNLPSAYSEPVIVDPADRINYGYNLITPGKILISGGTSLNDWIGGADSTQIDGGKISTDSIQTNSIVIGSRNITVKGITFEAARPGTPNRLDWSAGFIEYIDDDGNVKSSPISAGFRDYGGGGLTDYIYWTKNGTGLLATQILSTAMDNNSVILASYKSGIDLVTNYGRTVINGNYISTGTIDAQKIKTGTITSDQISAGSIRADKIDIGTVKIDGTNIWTGSITSDNLSAGIITADKIGTGTITAEKLTLSARDIIVKGIQFYPNTPVTDKVGWTAGTISSINTTGGWTTYNIAGNMSPGVGNGGSTVYLYFDSADNPPTQLHPSIGAMPQEQSKKLLAAYSGGNILEVMYGTTTITNNYIQTGTIIAANISAGTITANKIAANTITAAQIAADTITATQIKSGTITTDQLTVATRDKIADHFDSLPSDNGYNTIPVSGAIINFSINPNNGIIGKGTVTFILT